MPAAITRRHLLALAGASSLQAAMAGALHAEGGSPLATFDHATPISCAEVTLRVKDLDAMVAFYRTTLGLKVLERSATHGALGAGGTVLLRLIAAPDADLAPRNAAGLYHTAFLLPSEVELARWLVHIARREVRLTGFADHLVSQAVYLDDPEGNGIEVYCDRPPSAWMWMAGEVIMGTEPLDIERLLGLVDTDRDDFRDIAPQTIIGHIHLKVGDIAPARAFWQQALGFDLTVFTRQDAAFLSSGRYHHHLALNIWDSHGAGLRDGKTTGLDHLVLAVRDPALLAAQKTRLAAYPMAEKQAGTAWIDPWGTGVVLRMV